MGIIQGSRVGPFANLAACFRPLECSAIALIQQATSISPAFRDNVSGVIAFDSTREADETWLLKEYKRSDLSRAQFKTIIQQAWRGIGEFDERGKHFIFISKEPREPIQYFGDFDYALIPNEHHG